MATYEISNWFDRGCAQGDRYMSIYWDTYDGGHYPVYFVDAEAFFSYTGGDVHMEDYDLYMDKGAQLNERRANNGPKAPRRSARLAAKS
jgi:hypothetical protein